jgi:hypothetical protein
MTRVAAERQPLVRKEAPGRTSAFSAGCAVTRPASKASMIDMSPNDPSLTAGE